MRVLIIGGTGKISTAISRILVTRGDEVVLFNRGQTEAAIPGAHETLATRTAADRSGDAPPATPAPGTAGCPSRRWHVPVGCVPSRRCRSRLRGCGGQSGHLRQGVQRDR